MLKARFVKAALAAALITAFLIGSSVAAAPAGQQSSGVYSFADGSPVDGAHATLLRNDGGIRMTLTTSGLDAGGTYTIWWVIFNNPEACTDGVHGLGLLCGAGDLGSGDVAASVLYATGHVVGKNGKGNFGAHLSVGQMTNDVLFGPGLLDPRGAEVHLIVRGHGDPIPGLVREQISTVDGGCSINDCESQQFAAFAGP
ncbi:MAG TPA: hypothetical protein VMM78_12880 [Thermomicrobiales bacterium]|nr:hypothetical protein [Thermomicrobiales bacterium]